MEKINTMRIQWGSAWLPMRIRMRMSASAALLLTMISCTPKNAHNKSLIIAMNSRSSSALICLAKANNERIGKSNQWKTIGVERSLEGLALVSQGKSDMAVAASPTFFHYAALNPDSAKKLKIIAGINSIQNSQAIIARKTSGIVNPSDFRNKRLGHTGDLTTFFKNYFFLTEGLNESQVIQMSFKDNDAMMNALEKGTLDAAIVPRETYFRASEDQYALFYSKVHEISYQIVVSTDALTHRRPQVLKFLENLLEAEETLYNSDPETALKHLRECYPDSHNEILKSMLRRGELRVLFDESLRAQYNIYRKWMTTRTEFRNVDENIRSFELDDFSDPSLLRQLDYRRVLIK